MCQKKRICRSVALKNIITLSVALMFTFSAMRALCNAQKFIIKNIKETNPDYKVNSDHNLAVGFGMLSLTFWWAPYVIHSTSTKFWLMVFCFFCIGHIGQFLYPVTWVSYLSSAIVGVTAALSSTAHGHYLTTNSTQHTIGRNSGLFWAIIQFSMLVGNVPIYFWVKDKELDKDTRNYIFIFMLILCVIGFVIMCFLGKGVYTDSLSIICPIGTWFCEFIGIFFTRDVLVLALTFIYVGIKNAFISGIYSNAVGFTMKLDIEPNKALKSIALSGMMIGFGNVCGGTIFGLLGRKIITWGHYPIIVTGAIIHIVSYIIVILNLPNNSVLDVTYDNAIITSNYHLALLCSFLMGLGDACFSTQIIAFLAKKFAAESMVAFSINLFITNASTSAAFLYNVIGLYVVMGILVFMCIIGTISFTYVELRPRFHTVRELPRMSRSSLSESFQETLHEASLESILSRPWYKRWFEG